MYRVNIALGGLSLMVQVQAPYLGSLGYGPIGWPTSLFCTLSAGCRTGCGKALGGHIVGCTGQNQANRGYLGQFRHDILMF